MLILILVIPIIFSISVLLIRKSEWIKKIALTGSILELGLTLFALMQFRTGTTPELFDLKINWLPKMGIFFHLQADGLSMAMLLLTNLLIPIIIFSGFDKKQEREHILYALILFMQSALLGVFLSVNAFLFYIFWELALIPIYFIVLLWGGENRQRITLKFFIFTLAGSLFMLFSFLYLYFYTPTHSFELTDFIAMHLCKCVQQWLFWMMFVGFAVKIPIFPLHTWQPSTYTTASTQGTMLLSGIMLKMGLFGMLRWLLPVMPEGTLMWGKVVSIMAIIGIIYASVLAFRQKNIKTMLAYSSLAHVGLITAAVFAVNLQSLQGVAIQMLVHGINIVGLFFIADILFERLKTYDIYQMGGIKIKERSFAVLTLIIFLGSIALPLTNGFVGEFLMFAGIFKFNIWFGAIAGLSIIFGAVYMLYLYQKIMLGETNKLTSSFAKLTINERVILTFIAVLVIVMGVFPQPFLNLTEAGVQTLLSYFVNL